MLQRPMRNADAVSAFCILSSSMDRPFPPPKKRLGQHFLRRQDICHRIAALLQPQEEDSVVEIGPGPGALTRSLEALPHAHLLLLEKDPWWAAERQRQADARTQAVLIDALRFSWARLTHDRPWKLVGNLPYNVASPLIWDCLSLSTGWQRAVFMVQQEVGQRLVAQPGTPQYGALSVWVQSYARPRLEFLVGPAAFTPPPKVVSAVLSFRPVPLEQRPGHPHALAQLLRVLFQQRRKQVGGIARRSGFAWLQQALVSTQTDPSLRPADLSPTHIQRLAAFAADRTAAAHSEPSMG